MIFFFFFLRPPSSSFFFFFFNDTATTEIYTLSLHDALPVSAEQWATFQRVQELDFAHSIAGVSRYRGNLYVQRTSCGAVFRAIPHAIKPLDELGMPDSVTRFAHLPRGLVLVTGPTGSGKTTTLASILDLANRSRAAHIVTIEDPIEFLHPHKRSVVNQREVGSD